jgi:acyl-CoA synthetase (NDP forming)
MADAIKSMLHPKSVAIIGASPDANKLNGRPFHFMRRDGYAGKLYPVNPRYDEINGVKCYPDVAALPEAPDMAIVAVSAARCVETVEALGKKGCPVAVIFSSGFGEMGSEGKALEAKLLETARKTGIRVCGPNNLGLISGFERVTATFSQYADTPPVPGPVAFASQSGAFGTGIAALARSRGIGFGYFVNTGNQIDISLMEVLEETLGDERITVAAAYLEGLADADALVSLADKAIDMGKPLVAVKVGRKTAGARAAASHTGSLAGEDAVFDGVARQHGVIRARNEEHMLDLVAAFTATKADMLPKGGGLAIITQSGGAGCLMADRAEEVGLNVPVPSDETKKRLKQVIPEFGAVGNPVDITGQFLADPDLLKNSVGVLLDDPEVDIAVVWLQLMHAKADILIDTFRDIKAKAKKPFVVCWIEAPAGAREKLAEMGIPMIPATERAVDAAAGLVEFAAAKKRAKHRCEAPATKPDAPKPAKHPKPVPAAEAYARLVSAGVPLVDCRLAANPVDAASAAKSLGFPVVLKIESPDILHKFDVGGVVLGLEDVDAVAEAAKAMIAQISKKAPKAKIDGFLLQPMSKLATEMVIGMRRDPVFGPVVMAGLGGVFIEVLKDVAFARAPLSQHDAKFMLDRLQGRAMLEGQRGRSAPDLDALAAALVAVGDFALANPDVQELDLNPVFADTDGVRAVDWLMMA